MTEKKDNEKINNTTDSKKNPMKNVKTESLPVKNQRFANNSHKKTEKQNDDK